MVAISTQSEYPLGLPEKNANIAGHTYTKKKYIHYLSEIQI